MRILATMPGRIGDILWAMATVRAISETYGWPVDVACATSGKHYESILPLLAHQPYIAETACLADWCPREDGPDPFTPREPPPTAYDAGRYDQVFHLGYAGWPTPDLARDLYDRFDRQYTAGVVSRAPAPLALARPWITPPYTLDPLDLVVGFTDEHFELKYGCYWLLRHRYGSWVTVAGSPRWRDEAGLSHVPWGTAAAWVASSRLFVGCCSALHVLACAIGTPVVLLEPAPARWNGIFYPYGTYGPQVTLVRGSDGQPTCDARHLIETIDRQLAQLAESPQQRQGGARCLD
jgi:hypothetical protein